MSAIDTMNHAHVADFFNLPVYWILEEKSMYALTEESSDKSSMLNPYFLSIGGGSGEHSALILPIDGLISHFLYNVLENIQDDFNEVDIQISKLCDYIVNEQIKNKSPWKDWCFNKNQWPLKTFISIDEKINKHIAQYQSPNYSDNRALEKKIIDSIALFVIYEMPLKYCIKDKDLLEFATLIRSNTWHKPFSINDISKYYFGIDKPKTPNGRIIKNDQVFWGYSLDDWEKDNNSIILAENLSKNLSTKNILPKVKI